ncbi:hypothetical protein GCM10007047_03490 [Cerasicoccus arenae]|uniref:Tetratricopeptide repeat protein n=2 Tax=Cerasicoccus arenae TaxID=424488 RepID=A0A8J3D749_9BACT|nr:hypothetical protein GCM10007047_03490 [Cerasicoccus arenae]
MMTQDAKRLHQEARLKGQAGEYDAAIALLNQAIQIAPDWAYPRYDLAFTHLLINDPAKALAIYRQVDELEPQGFFATKTAVWSLEREAKEEFPRGLFLSYTMLEWEQSNESKLQKVNTLIKNAPNFAPAWKEKAILTENLDDRINYLNRGLSYNPDAETKGMLIMNKAMALQLLGRQKEANQLLQGLITDPQSTRATVSLSQQILKSMQP